MSNIFIGSRKKLLNFVEKYARSGKVSGSKKSGSRRFDCIDTTASMMRVGGEGV